MNSKSNFYSGIVNKVVYENDDFRILSLTPDSGEDSAQLLARTLTVKGNFPAQAVEVGTWLTFEARQETDPRYGMQLVVTRSPAPVKVWEDVQVLSALQGRGVGFTTRQALVKAAAQEKVGLADYLNDGAQTLANTLPENYVTDLLERWSAAKAFVNGVAVLVAAGLSSRLVSKIWAQFGEKAADILNTDPWALVQVPGVGFDVAETLAKAAGLPLTGESRMVAATIHAHRACLSDGDVFVPFPKLIDQVWALIPNADVRTELAPAIRTLRDNKSLVVDKTTRPGTVAIYDSWYHTTESSCADILQHRLTTAVNGPETSARYRSLAGFPEDLDYASFNRGLRKVLYDWAQRHQMDLSDDQVLAATRALTEPVSLLTGLPGTGKTTILKAIVALTREAGIPLLLAAPTGIAAKRIQSVTGVEALTIHRAFGAKGLKRDLEDREASYMGVLTPAKVDKGGRDNTTWGHGPDNPHPAEFLVVDECSMLDIHMLYRILSSTRPTCRILFVGDPYQLPSVGAGDVLRDLVRSRRFAHTHLTQIFRQAGQSGIVRAAHAIHAGRTPDFNDSDFQLVEVTDDEGAAARIVQLAVQLYNARVNFQVLSPRHGGPAGVTQLNQMLRRKLNPASSTAQEVRLGNSIIREGDRVMIVKNDYENGVYNGDVGKIHRVDKNKKVVHVKIFDGPGATELIVEYSFKDASQQLMLAYAQTVHKSQGQEYGAVILPMLPSFGLQRLRNLLYTGVTRAKDKAILVGDARSVWVAVNNNTAAQRSTLLSDRLTLSPG